ncbi:hypothetical protein niasHT_013328 [Heterodera trifolii]|uniref:G_PROTEIN_RECEP_F1_2 domain-containing protein n=1 Tax=Heterodera trifolii TaxID=157864 RepID=A0ABD2L7T6_9BILA
MLLLRWEKLCSSGINKCQHCFNDRVFFDRKFERAAETDSVDPFYALYKDAGIVPIELLTNGILAMICFVGICLNSALVHATIKTKSLCSKCNILIALYAFCASFMLIGYSIKFFVFLFGINYLTLGTCFYIQFVPFVGVNAATTLQLCIGIDRMAGVIWPIW